MLACFVWQNPRSTHLIEVVAGQAFDHVFVLIDRPWGSDINKPMTWGKETWLADPWSESIKKLINPVQGLKALFATGFNQTSLLAAAGITDPWRFSRHAEDTLSMGLHVLTSISPQLSPFPRYINFFESGQRVAMPDELKDEIQATDSIKNKGLKSVEATIANSICSVSRRMPRP